MSIYKIVLTGAPCSGKSEGLKKIKKALDKEYNIIIVEETSTLIRKLGFKWEKMSNYDFQELIFRIQKNLEDEVIKNVYSTKTIVLFDRCLLDGKIYSEKFVYEKILKKHNLCEEEIYNRYDLIIQLQSVANGMTHIYNYENESRVSNISRAIFLEEKEKNMLFLRDNYYFVGNNSKYNDKIEQVIKIIKEKVTI